MCIIVDWARYQTRMHNPIYGDSDSGMCDMAGLTEERLDVLSTQLFKTFDTDEVGAYMTLSVYAHATSLWSNRYAKNTPLNQVGCPTDNFAHDMPKGSRTKDICNVW